jgi:uncharacterized protein
MPADHLIIFVKNPVPGTVKTRIARSVGDEQATAVYRELLAHTQQVTDEWPGQKAVYYGDFVNPNDGWNVPNKHLQTGADLGERMQHAFAEQFGAGAGRVVIIGSDCFGLTTRHIERAFAALDTTEVVIGPATDGGYYLLGMTQPHFFVFEDMPWSQFNLRQQTEIALNQRNIPFTRLDTLTDIDEWTDYLTYLNRADVPGPLL